MNEIDLRSMALKCRLLAERMEDEETVNALHRLASTYETQAEATLNGDESHSPAPE